MRTPPYAWYTEPEVPAAFQRWVSDALAREPQVPRA